jgi:large subunit ribosomal protein L17
MLTLAGRKLGRPTGHRFQLLRNLATSLLMHEKVETTVPKAKELIRYADKIITSAKKKNLQGIREVAAVIQDHSVRKKVLEVLVPRYESRSGGYTKLIRSGFRQGDAAPMAIVKLIS